MPGVEPPGRLPTGHASGSAGGTKRAFAASATEILCFVVTWPNGAAGAENTQMGAVGNIDLAFDAR